jgi:hypothetical protein
MTSVKSGAHHTLCNGASACVAIFESFLVSITIDDLDVRSVGSSSAKGLAPWLVDASAALTHEAAVPGLELIRRRPFQGLEISVVEPRKTGGRSRPMSRRKDGDLPIPKADVHNALPGVKFGNHVFGLVSLHKTRSKGFAS